MFDENILNLKTNIGWGSVGRAPASDTRGSKFESSHRQNIIPNLYYYELLKRRKKRTGMAHLKELNIPRPLVVLEGESRLNELISQH